MKHKKLSKDEKSQIAREYTERVMKKRSEVLREKKAKFGDRIYSYLYGAHEKTIEALPASFVDTTDEFTVAFGTFGRSELTMTAARRLPRGAKYHGTALYAFAPESPYFQEHENLREVGRQLDIDRKEVWRKTAAVLQGIATTKKLQEQWPEGFDLAKELKIVREEGEALPAITVRELEDLVSKVA